MRRSVFALACVGGLLGSLMWQALGGLLAARNSSGTMQYVAGNPVVSGTAISSTVHNNTVSDFMTEITDSLSRSGKGAMLAPLELVASGGSTLTPALSKDGDENTGLYWAGDANPAISVNNAQIQAWSSTGSTFTRGISVTQSQSNTLAIEGVGSGTGVGVRGRGGGTAAGGHFSNGTAATGGTRQGALLLDNGDLFFTGTANATSTTSIQNGLTPSNVPKAWGSITVGSSAALAAGFNIASISCGSSDVTVAIAGDMASASYAVMLGVTNHGTGTEFIPGVHTKAAGSFVIEGNDSSDGTTDVDLCGAGVNGQQIDFVVFGNQ